MFVKLLASLGTAWQMDIAAGCQQTKLVQKVTCLSRRFHAFPFLASVCVEGYEDCLKPQDKAKLAK